VEGGALGLCAHSAERAACSSSRWDEKGIPMLRLYLAVQFGGFSALHVVQSLSAHVRTLWKLDYSAGVLPITHVERSLDGLSPEFKAKNAIEAGAYEMYDADAMHSLPIGVQVIGQRLQEEKVLEGMKIIEMLLSTEGKGYELLNT
jgi:hypothetical protein